MQHIHHVHHSLPYLVVIGGISSNRISRSQKTGFNDVEQILAMNLPVLLEHPNRRGG